MFLSECDTSSMSESTRLNKISKETKANTNGRKAFIFFTQIGNGCQFLTLNVATRPWFALDSNENQEWFFALKMQN